MKQRSLVAVVLFCFITFGLYPLYWILVLESDLKKKTNEGPGPVILIVFSIITCGIYTIYWYYTVGKRLAKLGGEDNSLIYLVLSIVFSIVGIALIQNQINTIESKQV